FVELYNRGEAPVDLTGWVLENGVHFAFAAGTTIAPGDHLVVAEDPDTLLDVFSAESIGPYQYNLSSEGERVVLRDATDDLVDEVSFGVGYPWPVASGGTGASMELIDPHLDNDLGGSWRASAPVFADSDLRIPTPGASNSVAADNAPPQSRQVLHTPQTPKTGEGVIVTVKVTDPQGVGAVSLEYQAVAPGAYIPSRFPVPLDTLEDAPDTPMGVNPAYLAPANWEAVDLNDAGEDGDEVAGDNRYAVTLPPQGHRTLVRYRIRVEDLLGAHVTVPYEDDPSLNFAYFVYDGVPDYGEHPAELLESLPVYTLISRPEDVSEVMAYNGYEQFSQQNNGGANEARSAYNWSATFVYDGIVYDHIRWRLRGSYGRYQLAGKRSFRFRFNRGHWLVAKDALGEPYAEPWRTLTTGKGFENRATLTYDLNCVVNNHLMRSVGVPAPYWHWFHFRVLDGVDEAPDPWTGDFWGLHSATETYDKRFLDSHGLPKGNLYKLVYAKSAGVEQRRYQAPDAVSDGSDHDNIEANVTGYSTASYIRAHVNLPNWYAYHAVAEAVRHYDFWPNGNKNQVYYFSPDYEPANSGYGRLWVLPWDSDSSWGPTW
ncbi:MAG: lamin tail domain-containing protein, partial [Myxococcota bacterium]|nr:lamin tail domain-containing protein [Myxococcota bacterium]